MKGVDLIEAMSFATDREFAIHLGVHYTWTRYIATIVARLAGPGNLEDILTSAVNNLLRDIAKDGKLSQAVQTAHLNSSTEEELLSNQKGVIGRAANYRIRDLRRLSKSERAIRFSEMADPPCEINPGEGLYWEGLCQQVVSELGRMKEESKGRSVAFLDLTIKLAPDRLAGATLQELMEKHGLKKAQCYSCIEAIQQAASRLAGRLGVDDPFSLALARCG